MIEESSLTRMRVIPTLLVDENGQLVKTVRFKKRTYIGDPINAVQIYNKKEVDELILLAIDTTKRRLEPNFALIEEIASEAFMPLAYGGGLHTMRQIEKIFDCGIEKVILSSAILDNPAIVREAAMRYGSQAISVCLPIRTQLIGGERVRLFGGRMDGGHPVATAQKVADLGAGEIIAYSIDKDGTWDGYSLGPTKEIADAVEIPVVACGGAGKIDDFLAAANQAGCSAVAAGSMFVFQGKERGVLITYPNQETLLSKLFSEIITQ